MHFIIITAVRHDDSCLLTLDVTAVLSIMNIAVSLFNPIITALITCVNHNSTAKNKVHITLADNIIPIVKPNRCTNAPNLF